MQKKNLLLLFLSCCQISFAQFDIEIKTLKNLELKGKVKTLETFHSVRLNNRWLDSSFNEITSKKYYAEKYGFTVDGNQEYYSLYDNEGICKVKIEINYHSSGQIETIVRVTDDNSKQEYNATFDNHGNLVDYAWIENGILKENTKTTVNIKKALVKTINYNGNQYSASIISRYNSMNQLIYTKHSPKYGETIVTKYFYDSQLNLTKEIGSRFTTSYAYDSKNRPTRVSVIRNDDEFIVYSFVQDFDENGNIVKSFISELGNILENHETSYDTQNRLIESTSFIGSDVFNLSFNYDSLGNMTHEIFSQSYDSDSIKIISEFIYKYDVDGNCIMKTKYVGPRIAGPIEETMRRFDSNNKLMESFYHGRENVFQTLFEWDSNGNMTHEILTQFLNDDSLKIISECTYKYDFEGNWIIKTEYIGPISDSLSETTRRNISYY